MMGEEADDVFTSNMTDKEAIDYNIMIAKLEEHFVVRRNHIFEYAKFNQR